MPDFSYARLKTLVYFIDINPQPEKIAIRSAFDIIKWANLERGDAENFGNLLLSFLKEAAPLITEKLGNPAIYRESGSESTPHYYWFGAWLAHSQPALYKIFMRNHSVLYFEKVSAIPFKIVVRNLPAYYWYNLGIFYNAKRIILHLIHGKNIRSYEGLTFMSRKMAHIFHTMAPAECPFEHLLAYSMALSWGCEKSLAKALCSYLPQGVPGPGMARSFLRWRGPVLKLRQWAPSIQDQRDFRILMAYIQHCMDEIPEWNMKGRSFAATMRRANEWMGENRKVAQGPILYWQGANYQEWNCREEETWYAIFQLNNSKALRAESQEMSHCVQSYAQRCQSGQCSIWSLRRKEENGTWRSLVTIQVSEEGRIVQARGKFNRQPTERWMDFVGDWARQENLTFV